MKIVGILLVLGFVGIFLISINGVFAETENITIAARSYEQIAIYLNQGDELKFAMAVSGGSNDDIKLTIFFPDGTDVSGGVYEEHSDSFVATSTGTYVFSFDNTFSLISNKFVQFSYQRIQNTYFVYVENPPSIAENADNVVYEATKAWMDANPRMNFYEASSPEKADFRVQWVKEFGTEYVGYAFGNKFVEVGLGDSNCNGIWQPYSQDHVEFIMKHEIGHILGYDHVDDPKSLMYPIALNKEYDWVIKKYTLGSGYGQFIPICSVKALTSYQFHVSIDDPTHGFDVYFVPSKDSLDKWSKGEKFRYYSDENCFSEGYLSIGGKCHGVKKESGLFVITDSVLSEEIATITVQYKEQLIPRGALLSPIDLKLNTPTQKTDEIITSTTPTPSSSQKSTITCGEGTILKDGVCVPKSGTESKSSSGGCLIATAAFGTELAPQVQQLRELRDNTLLQTESGSAFMTGFNEFYYSFSPGIADLERQNPVFKEIVKLAITPLITSLSILNYVEIDSEAEVLGYGISLILLNVGMYFAAPAIFVIQLKKKLLE